jgi:hypothetical protein
VRLGTYAILAHGARDLTVHRMTGAPRSYRVPTIAGHARGRQRQAPP